MIKSLPVLYENLSWQERREVREEYIKIQNGYCWYCGNGLQENPRDDIQEKRITRRLFPYNFFKHPIHLHHSHEDGFTIGAVHSKCNAVLWEYEGK